MIYVINNQSCFPVGCGATAWLNIRSVAYGAITANGKVCNSQTIAGETFRVTTNRMGKVHKVECAKG